jgi:muramidase (phage lysozyme)
MLGVSEIGYQMLALSDDGYNVLVGSTPTNMRTFSDYSTHPNVLNRLYNSTAAGKFQVLYRYWTVYKTTLQLPDFGHDSQDRIALQMISECGAINDVDFGRVEVAMSKVKSRWASLPGSGYGQHENRASDLIAAYTSFGGLVTT